MEQRLSLIEKEIEKRTAKGQTLFVFYLFLVTAMSLVIFFTSAAVGFDNSVSLFVFINFELWFLLGGSHGIQLYKRGKQVKKLIWAAAGIATVATGITGYAVSMIGAFTDNQTYCYGGLMVGSLSAIPEMLYCIKTRVAAKYAIRYRELIPALKEEARRREANRGREIELEKEDAAAIVDKIAPAARGIRLQRPSAGPQAVLGASVGAVRTGKERPAICSRPDESREAQNIREAPKETYRPGRSRRMDL